MFLWEIQIKSTELDVLHSWCYCNDLTVYISPLSLMLQTD